MATENKPDMEREEMKDLERIADLLELAYKLHPHLARFYACKLMGAIESGDSNLVRFWLKKAKDSNAPKFTDPLRCRHCGKSERTDYCDSGGPAFGAFRRIRLDEHGLCQTCAAWQPKGANHDK